MTDSRPEEGAGCAQWGDRRIRECRDAGECVARWPGSARVGCLCVWIATRGRVSRQSFVVFWMRERPVGSGRVVSLGGEGIWWRGRRPGDVCGVGSSKKQAMSAIVPAVGAYGASYVPTVGAFGGVPVAAPVAGLGYGAVAPGLGLAGGYGPEGGRLLGCGADRGEVQCEGRGVVGRWFGMFRRLMHLCFELGRSSREV